MTRCLAAANAPRNRSRVNEISSFAVYFLWVVRHQCTYTLQREKSRNRVPRKTNVLCQRFSDHYGNYL